MSRQIVVIADSVYGSTARYARHLADRLQAAYFSLEQAPALERSVWSAVIVCSPNYGGRIHGANFLLEQLPPHLPAALVVTGMSLVDTAQEKDLAADRLGPISERVERFYLPGSLAWSRLSRAHRIALWSLQKMLAAKPHRSANDESIISMVGTDIDLVDMSLLAPVEQWARRVHPEQI